MPVLAPPKEPTAIEKGMARIFGSSSKPKALTRSVSAKSLPSGRSEGPVEIKIEKR